MKRKIYLLIISVSYCMTVSSQYTTDKVVSQKQQELKDSLKGSEYPYILPIWGQKAVKEGFNLPLSAGLSAQYIWQESDIVIDNLKVGFNNGELFNMDDLVRFNNARSTSYGVNIRPDVWVLPFLNVYGIFAQSRLSTAIDAGIWLPRDSTWTKVMDLNTKAEFNATTFGFGFTPTIGVGGFFMAFDMNFTWSDINELDKPAYAFVFGPRIGKNIPFKKPGRSLALWAGGFRVKLNTGTQGSLSVGDLFPTDKWEQRIDTGYMKLEESRQHADDWWNSLSNGEQNKPGNIARYELINSALTRFGGVLDAASQAIGNLDNTTVQYSLDKKPKDMWNFLIGGQLQINRQWMIRAEYGFLTSRHQFIGGLQYRFGL